MKHLHTTDGIAELSILFSKIHRWIFIA